MKKINSTISKYIQLKPGNWTLRHLLIGLSLTVVGAILPAVVIVILGNSSIASIALPIQYFLMFILGMFFVYLWGGKQNTGKNLGLTLPKKVLPYAYAIGGGLAFVAIAHFFAPMIPSVKEGSETVAKQIAIGPDFTQSLILIISMAIAAPLGEELAYRGIIMRSLYDIVSRKAALIVSVVISVLISSTLFGYSHGGEGQSAQLVFLVVAGIIYAAVYLKTGSFTMAVLAHSITNTTNALMLLALAATTGVVLNPLLYLVVLASPFVAVGTVELTRRLVERKNLVNPTKPANKKHLRTEVFFVMYKIIYRCGHAGHQRAQPERASSSSVKARY